MKRLFWWLGNIVLALVILFVLSLLVPTVFLSGKWAVVRSSSMTPAMPAGALALMVPVEPEEVKVGDIISFDPPWDSDVTVSHRVVSIQKDERILFDTKGDAVEESDPYWIPETSVHGKVIFDISYLGFAISYVLKYLRTWWGFTVLVAIPTAILLAISIKGIVRSGNFMQKRVKLLEKRRRQWKNICR